MLKNRKPQSRQTNLKNRTASQLRFTDLFYGSASIILQNADVAEENMVFLTWLSSPILKF